MKRKTRKWLILPAILVVIAAITVYAISSRSTKQANGRQTVKVTRIDIIEKALAVGSIEPLNEIEIKSKVSGVVGRLFADAGDFVKAGDLLVEVKPDPTPMELAQAKRDVEMTTIELTTLGKELERQDELRKQGFTSMQDFEILQRQFDEARLKKQMAIERLELIEKGKVRIAETSIETVVKSPLAGFILEKSVNLGDPVVPLTSYQPGTALMRMADMTELIFKGTVDEIDVGKISEGLACELQVGALPGVSVNGVVTRISLKARKEDNTTVFPVEIKLETTDEAVLRAGYSANANIIIAKRDSVLSLPERVVYFRNDSAFVKLPTGENLSEERFIKTGLSDAINIEIIEGLEQDEEVLEKEVKEIT